MRREWTIGPVFVLRHAGMPFDWLEDLGAGPHLLAAADAVLGREADLLEAASAAGLPTDRTGGALRTLDAARLPRSPDTGWQRAVRDWREAVAEYTDVYAPEEGRASASLAGTLRRPMVQEAVFLSNPDAYRNMLLPYVGLRHGPDVRLNARWRRARRQLYGYLQRFCGKNETVSFFGPMGYGRVQPGDKAVLHTGRPRRRAVFLSSWAARELAAAVAADRRLRAVLPFRRTGAPGSLPEDRDLLAAAGPQGATLPQLAAPAGGNLRETAVRLSRLVAEGALEYGIAAGPYDLDPLRTMLDALGELPGSAARSHWMDHLERLRRLLRRFADEPFPQRVATVAELESAFTDATGRPARRGAGAVYADRAIYYEECASPFALDIGEDLLHAWARQIAPAMELSAAHGGTAQAAARTQVATLVEPGERLTLRAYAERALPASATDGSRFMAPHVPELAGDPAAHRDDLLASARKLPGDRYALVDLCPMASSADALGDARLLLSRCHHHLLTDGWLATMAEDRAGFSAAADAWLARRPHLVGLDVGRRNKGYYRYPGRRIALRPRSHDDDTDVLHIQQVSVVRAGEGVRALDPEGRELELYLPLSDYVKYPPYAALSSPQVLHAVFSGAREEWPQGPGTAPIPVEVGAVVYQRPQWTLDPADFRGGTPTARFLALRRLAADTGRFVFIRSDTERKPYLVDLESVLAGDLLGHAARDAETLIAEPMLPGPEALWLRDEDGLRYTCELRMQVTGEDVG